MGNLRRIKQRFVKKDKTKEGVQLGDLELKTVITKKKKKRKKKG